MENVEITCLATDQAFHNRQWMASVETWIGFLHTHVLDYGAAPQIVKGFDTAVAALLGV
jgi:hypothetical protein